MITENAKVVSVDASGTFVATSRKSVCGQCQANKACGTSVLSKVVGKKLSVVKVVNEIDAQEGDEVIIGLEENAFLKGAMSVYLIPLVYLFAFSVLGNFLAEYNGIQSEWLTIVFAVAGLYLGLKRVRKYFSNISLSKEYQPVILEKSATQTFAVTVNANK